MRGLEGPTRSVTRGTDIILHCRYDLEAGDRLYAVKWFHGTREFYRFQPELQPPARSFPIEDVYVDVFIKLFSLFYLRYTYTRRERNSEKLAKPVFVNSINVHLEFFTQVESSNAEKLVIRHVGTTT